MGHEDRKYPIRNIIFYSVSPYHLSPIKTFMHDAVGRTWRRFRSQFFYITPALLSYFAITSFLLDYHDKIHRKKPGQFDNEEEEFASNQAENIDATNETDVTSNETNIASNETDITSNEKIEEKKNC